MDGAVTTFAVVAGAVGLETGIILILGFANLIADGFAMSIGAYLSSRTREANKVKASRLNLTRSAEEKAYSFSEYYKKHGFEGELLSSIVAIS